MPAAEIASKPPVASRTRRTSRAVGQILAALKNSKNPDGPTMTQIFKFITSSLVHPATKRQVIQALKRGVSFGILKRRKGHYSMSEIEDSPTKPATSVLPKKIQLHMKKVIGKSTKKFGKKHSNRNSTSIKSTRRHRDYNAGGYRTIRDYPIPPTSSTITANIKAD